jgi:hypothetical protein
MSLNAISADNRSPTRYDLLSSEDAAREIQALAQNHPQLVQLLASSLSAGERTDLFNTLAGSMSGSQLAQLSTTLTDPSDLTAFANSVARFAPPDVATDFANQTGNTNPTSADLVGLAAATGREQFVRAQLTQAANAASHQPATSFDGDLYRAVPTARFQTYADHTWSAGGRYNAPAQSALYTAPSLADVQAEAGNYSGMDNNSVVRSRFSGQLLDLRSLPNVVPEALMEPYGSQGSHRTVLSRLTGEDPYTLTRAVADQARLRGLNGVIAPANQGNTNVALFPDDPNAPAAAGSGRLQSGLTYLDQQDFAGRGTPTPYRAAGVAPPPVDVTPNRSSPAVDVSTYTNKVTTEAAAHSRAGGARYGAAGAGIVTLVGDVKTGHFDAGQLATNVAGGAAVGQADTLLSRAIDRAITPPIVPPNVAGSALVDASVSDAGAATRAVSVAAGISSAGIVGGVVSGGVSIWTQADAVKNHQVAAGQATANVVVDTGVGVASGLAGAAAGAAVGSVVPVAGTAVGAVVGFAVGMGVGWVAQHSGAINAAKQALGRTLTDHFEKPLQKAWDVAAKGVDAVKSAGATVAHAASSAWHAATSWL